MWNKNALTQVLKLDWPIVQGPFGGGLSSVELASTVSNLGGLGSYGAHYMAPDLIGPLVKDLKSKTNRSFAVNLWISDHDVGAEDTTKTEFERYRSFLAPVFEHLKVPLPQFPEKFGHKFEFQIEELIKARPPVFSFVFGIPEQEIIRECRKQGILTVGTAITVEEAMALDEAGVDAIVVSGFEAGGHRVSFLRPPEESLVGSFSLIPMVADRVSRPIISAGGIGDGRGVAAALTLGASGVQIGTAFLACDESAASATHKAILRSKQLRPTALTRAFSGRLARGIENKFMREFGIDVNKIAPFPVQSWLTSQFKKAAIDQGQADYFALWAGQSYPQVKHTKAADLMAALISETNDLRRH